MTVVEWHDEDSLRATAAQVEERCRQIRNSPARVGEEGEPITLCSHRTRTTTYISGGRMAA